MNRKFFIVTLLAFLLGGCGTAIKLAEFSKAPMMKSDFLPSKSELKGKKRAVLILQFDENHINIATNSHLGNAIAGAVEKELSKANLVSVVKRVDNFNLKRELEASELSKKLNIDTGAAEYLITGEIVSATFNRDYTPERREVYYDKKRKRRVIRVIPAKNHYKACSEGNIQIYQLPSLKNVKSIPFKGCEYRTEVATNRYYYDRDDAGVVRESGINAIKSASSSLKSFFAIKGYILEKRVNRSKETILLTTLGKYLGAREGADVNIYTIKEIKNPITNEIIKQPMKIGEGKISNQISTNTSWIIVDKIDEGEIIKIGDYIKIDY